MRTTMMPTLASQSLSVAAAAGVVVIALSLSLCLCPRLVSGVRVAFNQSGANGQFDELTAIRRSALTLLQVYRVECDPAHTKHPPTAHPLPLPL